MWASLREHWVLHHLLKKGDNIDPILFTRLDQALHLFRAAVPAIDPSHHFVNDVRVQTQSGSSVPELLSSWAHIVHPGRNSFLAT
jgi:hypothetical protein